MPIEGWIVFGICAAGLIAQVVLMIYASNLFMTGCGGFPLPPGKIPPPPRGKYGIGACPPAPLPYKHIGNVVIPNSNIKPGIKPPKD